MKVAVHICSIRKVENSDNSQKLQEVTSHCSQEKYSSEKIFFMKKRHYKIGVSDRSSNRDQFFNTIKKQDRLNKIKVSQLLNIF